MTEAAIAPRRAAGLLIGFAVLAPLPAGAITEFMGGGFLAPVDWTAEACASHGWTGVHQLIARLQPQGGRGNLRDESQLSLMLATGTVAMRYNLDRGIRATYRPTQSVHIWNGPWVPETPTMGLSWFGGDWPVGNAPEFPNIRLRIENWNEHEGCTVEVSLFLRRNR